MKRRSDALEAFISIEKNKQNKIKPYYPSWFNSFPSEEDDPPKITNHKNKSNGKKRKL
ncbi:hypothetical protein J2810_004597 [Chryseobacterium rhizosphaerae]|uniref:hypothetical protein n=1 Tax=Chryseobacterium rhizosphaerae TaxID=395937 RepID=UPI002866E22A|nr:hypothetical protein [Chryseobacterium rhizosphaerae]MDR6548507.1 hypothetical protein [Chryseobacterium rhizosphaerae]